MEDPPSSPSPQPSSSLAALSIYQVARLYCRERLIVNPLQWTSRHVELLQCFFEEPSLAKQPNFVDGHIGKQDGSHFVKEFGSPSTKARRQQGIRGILAGSECPFTARDDLSFHFGEHYFKTLPCIVFFLRPNPNEQERRRIPPVVAYIDRKHINDLRASSLPSYRRRSKPTSALFNLQLKNITPPNPLLDPYIVALLIAIAYEQRYALQLSGEDNSSTFVSQVLLSDSDDKKCMHLFVADISSSFLAKLDFPTCPPLDPVPPSVSIRHTMVPYRPRTTFRKRILSLLLPAPNIQETGLR
ncbi:hypothetical protein B7463_g8717, partial [Scytalidium lignicola]